MRPKNATRSANAPMSARNCRPDSAGRVEHRFCTKLATAASYSLSGLIQLLWTFASHSAFFMCA